MNRSYLSSDEIERRLETSSEQAKTGEFRKVYCPRCHKYLVGVYSRHSEIVKVKCVHCGFNDPIDIRLFRTQKKKRQESFEEFMARYENDTSYEGIDCFFSEELEDAKNHDKTGTYKEEDSEGNADSAADQLLQADLWI